MSCWIISSRVGGRAVMDDLLVGAGRVETATPEMGRRRRPVKIRRPPAARQRPGRTPEPHERSTLAGAEWPSYDSCGTPLTIRARTSGQTRIRHAALQRIGARTGATRARADPSQAAGRMRGAAAPRRALLRDPPARRPDPASPSHARRLRPDGAPKRRELLPGQADRARHGARGGGVVTGAMAGPAAVPSAHRDAVRAPAPTGTAARRARPHHRRAAQRRDLPGERARLPAHGRHPRRGPHPRRDRRARAAGFAGPVLQAERGPRPRRAGARHGHLGRRAGAGRAHPDVQRGQSLPPQAAPPQRLSCAAAVGSIRRGDRPRLPSHRHRRCGRGSLSRPPRGHRRDPPERLPGDPRGDPLGLGRCRRRRPQAAAPSAAHETGDVGARGRVPRAYRPGPVSGPATAPFRPRPWQEQWSTMPP